MFKKLFCKYEYKYLDTVRDCFDFRNNGYAIYRFICSKCGKTYYISQRQLERFLLLAKKAQIKLKLSGETFDFESSKIVLQPVSGEAHIHEGKYVSFVLQHFAEQGIYLNQLPGNG